MCVYAQVYRSMHSRSLGACLVLIIFICVCDLDSQQCLLVSLGICLIISYNVLHAGRKVNVFMCPLCMMVQLIWIGPRTYIIHSIAHPKRAWRCGIASCTASSRTQHTHTHMRYVVRTRLSMRFMHNRAYTIALHVLHIYAQAKQR